MTARYLKTLFQVTAAKAEAIKERDEAMRALRCAEARIAELEARLR